MTIGMLFWVLMVVWIAVGAYYTPPADRFGWGSAVLLWVLLFLLGWQAFGFPIRG